MPTDPERRADTLHAVVTFLMATLGWMFLSAILSAALASGSDLPLEAAMTTPRMLAVGALLQTVGTGTIAIGLPRWFAEPTSDRWDLRNLAVGAVAGVGVGLLPGWIAAHLTELLDVPTVLSSLAEALHSAPGSDRALLVLAICGVAPVAEELAFRGFLWRVVTTGFGERMAWITTSLLFVGYHLDPIQTPSLVPTALLLGALRWRTGSVWPAVAAHVANNAIAMVVLLGFEPDTLPAIPLWLALGGTALSWTVLRAARPPAPPSA